MSSITVEVNRRRVALHLNSRMALSAWRHKGVRVAISNGSGYGITAHRKGGFSVVGLPRRGGTTIAFGRRLKSIMRVCARDCRRIDLGVAVVYSGRDF